MKRVLTLFLIAGSVTLGLFLFAPAVLAQGTGSQTSCCPTGYIYCSKLTTTTAGCYKGTSSLSCIGLPDASVFNCNITEDCADTTTQGVCQPKTTQTICNNNWAYYGPKASPPVNPPVCCPPGQSPGSSSCQTATASNATCGAGEANLSYTLRNGVCVAVSKSDVFLCFSGENCLTAIGNIAATPAGLVNSLFKFLIGIAGSVALIMLILAGYQLMTSAGDPQKVGASKELIVAVITGLLLIIFSLVLLQTIGVDILGIKALTQAPSFK